MLATVRWGVKGWKALCVFFGWTQVRVEKRNVPDSEVMGATGLASIELYLIAEQRKSISGDRISILEIRKPIMEDSEWRRSNQS